MLKNYSEGVIINAKYEDRTIRMGTLGNKKIGRRKYLAAEAIDEEKKREGGVFISALYFFRYVAHADKHVELKVIEDQEEYKEVCNAFSGMLEPIIPPPIN